MPNLKATIAEIETNVKADMSKPGMAEIKAEAIAEIKTEIKAKTEAKTEASTGAKTEAKAEETKVGIAGAEVKAEVGINKIESPNHAEKLSKPQLSSITNHMITQIKSGASSIELTLQPEHLGKIQMLLQSNEGTISVQILAQTSEALTLLNANSHSIKDAIEQQGIKLNDVNINLAQDNQSQPNHHEERSGNISDNILDNIPYEEIIVDDLLNKNVEHGPNLLNILA